MKKLLPILLCYMLMTSQVFAISGGPQYGGRGVNPVGTYSGVIQVTKEFDYDAANVTIDPTTGAIIPVEVADVNAIGLFALGVPTTSVAQGAFLLFVEGIVYNGTIVASVNPDTDQLSGIVRGTYNYKLSITAADGTVTSISVTAQASGPINARIGNTRQGAISSASITGTSNISINNGRVDTNTLQFPKDKVLQCKVVGFRQSTTASTISSIGTTTGT